MKNLISDKSVMIGHLLIVCSALLLAPLAHGESPEARCSNRTLKGDYGFKVDGQILFGPRAGLLRAVAMTHFDGQGELTQVDFATVNGVPTGADWRPLTGTYSMNPDCTGKAQLNPEDGSPSLRLRLVVVKGGKEIFTIVEGNATGSVGVKVNTVHNHGSDND